MTGKSVKVDESAQTVAEWSIEDIKAIETQIGTDLANAGHLLILGVTAKFYRATGDKDGAAWMRRVMAGSGFTFDRKRRTDNELSARDQAIVALLNDRATLSTIADTLGIGVATAHKVMTDNNVTSAGGTKRGAGRTATTPVATVADASKDAATGEAVSPAEATTGDVRRATRTSDPVPVALAAIERIGASADPEDALTGWAIVFAHLLETSGYDAETLAAHAAKLAAAGKAIDA